MFSLEEWNEAFLEAVKTEDQDIDDFLLNASEQIRQQHRTLSCFIVHFQFMKIVNMINILVSHHEKQVMKMSFAFKIHSSLRMQLLTGPMNV